MGAGCGGAGLEGQDVTVGQPGPDRRPHLSAAPGLRHRIALSLNKDGCLLRVSLCRLPVVEELAPRLQGAAQPLQRCPVG